MDISRGKTPPCVGAGSLISQWENPALRRGGFIDISRGKTRIVSKPAPTTRYPPLLPASTKCDIYKTNWYSAIALHSSFYVSSMK